MSRSRRKPYATDNGPARKFFKRQANKKIRQKEIGGNMADNSGFKKEYESWNICDFSFFDSTGKASRK